MYPYLLLALFPAAHAHYPHDVGYWLAISPDPERPRLATSLERIDLDLLGRSDDGLGWEARLVQPVAGGQTLSGALLSVSRLVLGTNGRGLLVSSDAGDTFAVDPSVTDAVILRVMASPAVLWDNVAFALSASTVWRTTDGGASWAAVASATVAGFTDLDLSPAFAEDGRVCAVEPESMTCSADGGDTWTRVATPPHTSRVSVGAGQRVWTAGREQGLRVSLDAGASWSPIEEVGTDIATVQELSGGLVLVAKAEQAEWRSTDGGATWSFVDVLHIANEQGGGDVEFFDFQEGPDGAVYLTCWNGVARSDDRGMTYTFYVTERPENAHTVELTAGGTGGLSAWIGTYGSGPILTDLATLAATPFPSLPVRFTRSSLTTPRWDRDGVAIHDEGYSTWRTTDGGASWTAIVDDPRNQGKVELTEDVKGVALSPDPQADPFLLATVGDRAMQFLVSENLGDTWITGKQDPLCEEAGFAVALSPRWPEEARAWGACGGKVYESLDRGRTWAVSGDTGAAFVFRMAEQADGTLLVATTDGLWRLHEGATERVAFDGKVVTSVAAATDATVFALVPTQGWMRSDDGGRGWVTLRAPTADLPRMVALSPTFAEDGTVAVAGYGGSWASTDRGESWFPIHALDVYEEDSDAWRIDGRWQGAEREGASGRGVSSSDEVGARRSIDLRGIALAIEAPADAAEGVALVTLDGGEPQEVTLPTGTGTLWSADGLRDGWHTLEIEVVLGEVTLDTVRATRLPERTPDAGDTGDTATDTAADTAADTGDSAPSGGDADPDDPRGCGCGSGAAAALWLLPVAGLRRRLTSRSPRPAAGR